MVTLQQTALTPPQIYQPLALSHHQQGYCNKPQQSGGRGRTAGLSGGCSCGGCGCARSRGSPEVPIPYVGGAQLIPYIQGQMQQGQHTPTKCIGTKVNGTQTRTCATHAALTLKISKQAQHANARSRGTRMALPIQTTCSTPKQGTHSARS